MNRYIVQFKGRIFFAEEDSPEDAVRAFFKEHIFLGSISLAPILVTELETKKGFLHPKRTGQFFPERIYKSVN